MQMGTAAVVTQQGTVDDRSLALHVTIAANRLDNGMIAFKDDREDAERAERTRWLAARGAYQLKATCGVACSPRQLYKARAEMRRLEEANKRLRAEWDSCSTTAEVVSAHPYRLFGGAYNGVALPLAPPSTLCVYVRSTRVPWRVWRSCWTSPRTASGAWRMTCGQRTGRLRACCRATRACCSRYGARLWCSWCTTLQQRVYQEGSRRYSSGMLLPSAESHVHY
jgi:hypothetical protein